MGGITALRNRPAQIKVHSSVPTCFLKLTTNGLKTTRIWYATDEDAEAISSVVSNATTGQTNA